MSFLAAWGTLDRKIGIPDTIYNKLFCMAAYGFRNAPNISLKPCFHKEKGRRNPAALEQ
jgi:hypothetical protein